MHRSCSTFSKTRSGYLDLTFKLFENLFFHTILIKEMYMLIKYEGVVKIFNKNINWSNFWTFSWMSHYFWTWTHIYPTMMKLATVIPYPNKVHNYINHVTHSSSSVGISIFSPEINVISENTNIDWILIHNFYFFQNLSLYFKGCWW